MWIYTQVFQDIREHRVVLVTHLVLETPVVL